MSHMCCSQANAIAVHCKASKYMDINFKNGTDTDMISTGTLIDGSRDQLQSSRKPLDDSFLIYLPFYLFLFFCCILLSVFPSPACLKVGMPSSCHSFLLLLCSHFFLSDSPELEAPLCACGLFTRNTDSPSEVWLARTGMRVGAEI